MSVTLRGAPVAVERPKVTVGIVHFERPRKLVGAIASVMNQTYPNIEIVVVDDGQGCSVLKALMWRRGFPPAKMSEIVSATTRIGGCPMPASLLEVLCTIPDHRRDEGKRFDLATVLLYAILSMVAGANSYRQMHEFIRIHLQRLNEAFGLRLRCSPSYTGLRLIIQGVDPTALEAAFRQHALSISTPPPSDGLTAIAVDGKTLARQFRRLQRPQGDAHDVGVAASRSDRARPSDGRGEEQRDSGRAGTDRGARLEGLCVHVRRRTRPKKRSSA